MCAVISYAHTMKAGKTAITLNMKTIALSRRKILKIYYSLSVLYLKAEITSNPVDVVIYSWLSDPLYANLIMYTIHYPCPLSAFSVVRTSLLIRH